MLEGLDKINWSELHHANVSASEVPNWIRGLLSEDTWTRANADHELFENLQHEGVVYDATFYALPFLFELLKFSVTPEKDMIAMLIAHISAGSEDYYRGLRNKVREKTYRMILAKDNKILEDELEKEKRLAQSIHLTIEKDLHLLYPYLLHEDFKVRTVIAITLRAFPNLSKETIPLLEKALEAENNLNTRKTMEHVIKTLNETK